MKLTEKIFAFLLILISKVNYGQRPREIQVDNEPPIWEDPAVIVVLIVVPVILLIFGIVWYKRRQRKIQNIKDQLKKDDTSE